MFKAEDNVADNQYSVEEDEYWEIINQGKNTAPGHDYVTKNLIRQLDLRIHKYIIRIYEYCMRKRFFLDEWKIGTIVTIPKPGMDHSKAANHRPITLLPVLGKNFEKL